MPHKQVKTQFWENNVTTQTWVGSRLNCKIKIYLLVQFVHKTIILIDILKEGNSGSTTVVPIPNSKSISIMIWNAQWISNARNWKLCPQEGQSKELVNGLDEKILELNLKTDKELSEKCQYWE